MTEGVMNITRCNLLATVDSIKSLSGKLKLAQYSNECPDLYTTNLFSLLPATFNSGINAGYTAQEPYTTSVTTPSSSYTVPAVYQVTQPNILLGSQISSYIGEPPTEVITSSYSGINGTGTFLGSIVETDTSTVTVSNFYTGANGTGTLTCSYSVSNPSGTEDLFNFYTGGNETGYIVLSAIVNFNDSPPPGNYYSGPNGTGDLLGSNLNSSIVSSTDSYSNYYTGANGTGTIVGSTDSPTSGNYTNYYSGANGTGTEGLLVNQFYVPYPVTLSIPSYTVTIPATTTYTNHPGVYSLTLATPLAAIPTGIYLTDSNLQAEDGGTFSIYTQTGSNLIASGTTNSTIYLNGPQTFINGQVIQAIVDNNPVNLIINSIA